MKRPRSPCFAGQRRRRELLRRLHDSEAASAAPLFRRKRSLDCGLDRTPGSPPPVKRPRLDVSHAFLREVQETPKEPTFGKVGFTLFARHIQERNACCLSIRAADKEEVTFAVDVPPPSPIRLRGACCRARDS
ncbi:hypothetical protein MTO96_033050 [Rhipicephalus appendiculatus]